MKSGTLLLLVATALVCAGCGFYHWRKPGAGAADFKRDSAACEPASGAPGDAFSTCMSAKGWSME